MMYNFKIKNQKLEEV